MASETEQIYDGDEQTAVKYLSQGLHWFRSDG